MELWMAGYRDGWRVLKTPWNLSLPAVASFAELVTLLASGLNELYL